MSTYNPATVKSNVCFVDACLPDHLVYEGENGEECHWFHHSAVAEQGDLPERQWRIIVVFIGLLLLLDFFTMTIRGAKEGCHFANVRRRRFGCGCGAHSHTFFSFRSCGEMQLTTQTCFRQSYMGAQIIYMFRRWDRLLSLGLVRGAGCRELFPFSRGMLRGPAR